MSLWLDGRIAVTLAPAAPGQQRALRIVAEATVCEADQATTHPPGCACCGARAPLALALDRLFLARVRGEMPFFRAITIACAGDGARAAARDTLEHDPVVASRFRIAAG